MATPKLRQLTLFSLRSGVHTADQIFKKPGTLTSYPLRAGLPFGGTFYTRRSRQRRPDWLEFVRTGIDHPLEGLHTSSASGVLVLNTHPHQLAITFGYGRFLLRADVIERDFGLRVTLNAVDPDKLRSVDVKTFQELTLHTRRQTSRGSALPVFGLDVTRDVLRAVMGQPRDPTLGTRLLGGDSLSYTGHVEFEQLAELATRLEREYRSRRYRERFAWVDHLRVVQDPALITRLNDRLVDALRAGDTEKTHLAPPETVDWLRIQGFSYPNEARDILHADLDIDEFLASQDVGTITLTSLRRWHIRVLDVDGETYEEWSVYRCLVFEAAVQGKIYALTGGEWFQVNLTFSQEIDVAVRDLAQPPPRPLPTSTIAEEEDDYNARAARALDVVLLDRQLVRTPEYSHGIEPADLFWSGVFVHVKRRTKSSTLSHLFAQGTVSGDLLLGDRAFRERLRELIAAQKADWFGEIAEPVRADTFTIVYAVIARPKGTWPLSLPFFSRLHAKQAADFLMRRGFSVRLVRIDAL